MKKTQEHVFPDFYETKVVRKFYNQYTICLVKNYEVCLRKFVSVPGINLRRAINK